jgi:hypothetical protein
MGILCMCLDYHVIMEFLEESALLVAYHDLLHYSLIFYGLFLHS